MFPWVFLLGEREESPGEFPNRTANRPTQRVLLSAQVQIILSTCFEQIEQLVFRVGNLLVPGEIVTPATRVTIAEIVRVDGDQDFLLPGAASRQG
jgi:hypothetical protein